MNNTKIFLTGTARGGTQIVAKMLSANENVNIATGPLLEILRLQRNLVLNKFDNKKYSLSSTSKLPFQDYYYSDESIKILDLVMNLSANVKLSKNIWKKHLNIVKKRTSIENQDLVKHINKIYNPNFTKLISNCFEVLKTTRNLRKNKIIGILDWWIIEMFLPLAKSIKNSKFIVIIRDPRASIASHTKKKYKGSVANSLSFIRCWRKMIAFTIYYKSLKIFKNRLCVVTHEDLLENPKKICKKLCNFLNVKFESEMLNTANYLDYSTGKIWQGNSSFENKTFGFKKKRANRWRKELSYSEIRAIEFIAHHELKLLNYKLYKNNSFSELKNGLSLLINDDQKKRKWKTSTKKTEFNYGVEFFRNYIFNVNSVEKDENLLRRLFLFKEVYKKIRGKKIIFRSGV